MKISSDVIEGWIEDINSKCFNGLLIVGIGYDLLVKQSTRLKDTCGIFRTPRKNKDNHLIILNPAVHSNTHEYKMTLAHELIHLFQAKNGLPLDHDQLFTALCKHCAKQLKVHYKEIL